MLRQGIDVVVTTADSQSLLSAVTGYASHDQWQKCIAELQGWLADTSQLEDDGDDAPAPMIIRLALDYAEGCRDQGLVAPDLVVPDAGGGIVFRRREDDTTEEIHFWEDGALEYFLYVCSRLIDRRPFDYVC